LHAPDAMKGYYAMMKARIADLQASQLGADWDGVYVATSK